MRHTQGEHNRFQVLSTPSGNLSPKVGQYLVRVPRKEGQGVKWIDDWLEPAPIEQREVVVKPVDEVRLERIRKSAARRRGGVWEMDCFHSPVPVEENGERPYYPYTFLWVDYTSTRVLNIHLATSSEHMTEFSERFLKLLESLKWLPKEIRVQNEELFKVTKPITSQLGVKIRLVNRLVAVDAARASLERFLA